MALSALAWIIVATVINSLIAFVGIFSLWCRENTLKRMILILVAFSAGALLGGAFLHLTAEALGTLETNSVFLLLITGFSVFFLIEKFLKWHHCHEGKCDVHPFTYLILFGDGIHNFIDGLIIAASFLVNPAFGIITTIMIISHEFPQELGDFGVLIYGGMEKKKALVYNFISQMTSIAGGIIGFFISSLGGFQEFLLPFAAGGFIYIAASDLIPELHKESDKRKSILVFGFFIVGVLFMLLIKLVFGG
jgi:zinc and cadmium transporter